MVAEMPMANQMQAIAAEREAAQAALAAAEQMMLSASRDPAVFRKAKKDHDAAAETIERLKWAEKAELERQERAAQQAKVDALREAQQKARDAHARAKDEVLGLAELTEVLVEKVRRLQAAQAEVDRGARYESFARRDGYLDRQTLPTRIGLSADAAVRVLRAGRELAILSGMPPETAEMRSAQGKL